MKLHLLKPKASFSHILGIKYFEELYDNNQLEIIFHDYPMEILNILKKDKKAFGIIPFSNSQNQINNQTLNKLEDTPQIQIWDLIQLPTYEFICNQEKEFHSLSLTPNQFEKHYEHLSKKYTRLNLIQVPTLEHSLELAKSSAKNACIANQYQSELHNLSTYSEELSPQIPDQKFIVISQQVSKKPLQVSSAILTPTKFETYYSLLPILHVFRENQVEINHIQEFTNQDNQKLFYIELEGNPKQARYIKSKFELEKDMKAIHLRFLGGKRKS
jgi:hypothetical protein